jgi:hypothetical protein
MNLIDQVTNIYHLPGTLFLVSFFLCTITSKLGCIYSLGLFYVAFWVLDCIHGFVVMSLSRIESFLFSRFITKRTRTAWAVFKYCGTKTVTLRMKKKYEKIETK